MHKAKSRRRQHNANRDSNDEADKGENWKKHNHLNRKLRIGNENSFHKPRNRCSDEDSRPRR